MLRLFLLWLLALLLSGCTAAGPRVTVERARWTEASDEAAVLSFDLHLTNPTAQPVELREVHYRVALNGRHVYSGRRAAAMTLAPGADSHVILPAVVRFDAPRAAELAEQAGVGTVSGSMVLVAPGRLALIMRDLGLPRPRSGFRGSAAVAGEARVD